MLGDDYNYATASPIRVGAARPAAGLRKRLAMHCSRAGTAAARRAEILEMRIDEAAKLAAEGDPGLV
jgi:hypothetical protein